MVEYFVNTEAVDSSNLSRLHIISLFIRDYHWILS